MAGYTRQSAASIVALAEITAAPLNAEFNQIQSAFSGTTGHTHSGGGGDGPLIPLTTSITGVLPVANGGTGVATFTAGLLVGTGTSVLITRVLTGTAAEITVTNGSGVSGAPTLSLPTALTFTGKTVTGGTFASPTISGTMAASGTVTVTGTWSGGTHSGQTLVSPTITTSPTAVGATWTNLGTVTTADINGGTIDGTVIGGSSVAAGSFTTLLGTTITGSTAVVPDVDGGADLGTSSLGWSTLFMKSTGVLRFANTDWVATHSTGILTVGTGDLRVTTAGTNTASVVTVGGTQTLTSKTLTSPIISGPTISGTLTASGTVTMSGTFNSGTYTGAAFNGTLGATTPAAASVTTLSGTGAQTGFTTGAFSSTVSMAGLTATTGAFSSTVSMTALTATTGAFSSTVSMTALTATTGTFSSTISGTTITASTAMRAPVGTTSAPTYSFTGNSNTGLSAPEADILSIVAGSAETARFSTTAFIVGSDSQITVVSGSDVGFSAGMDGHCGILTANDSGLAMRRLGGVGGVIQTYVDGAGNPCGNITTSTGATAFNTSSDGTLKTNVRPIKHHASIIDNLNPVKFDWIFDGKSGYGLIAQEAIKVFPHAVSINDEGIYSIDYSKFVPVILAELKALRLRVAELEKYSRPS